MINRNVIPQSRNSAILRARQVVEKKTDLYFLDTETTGLGFTDEIVEIAIVSFDGSIAFESLVKPYIPIPKEASKLHGILDSKVQNAPRFMHVWAQVEPLLQGKTVGIYNDDFDIKMIRQSLRLTTWKPKFVTIDIMKIFSEYIGEWDSRRLSYRYFKLDDARNYFRIPIQNSHRAGEDALLARAVLLRIAGITDPI